MRVPTVMGAVKARAGTTAVICVEERLVARVTGTDPNRTELVLRRPVPEMVTTVPTGPPAGVNPVIAGSTLKFDVVMKLPPGAVRVILPKC